MVAGQAVPSSDTDGSVASSPSAGSLSAEQPLPPSLPEPRSETSAERSGPLSRAEVHAGFAAALRAGMAATALRQRELGTRVGVSPGRISQYLNYPDKLPARWDRIAELLGAAGAEVGEFSRSFGAFWPDHPATPKPEAGTEHPATGPDEAGEPDAAERPSGEGDLAEAAEGEGPADGAVPSANVAGFGSGALEAATMVDANAAATGLVLSTPIPPEAPATAATAPPAQAAARASLEVATELAVPAVAGVPPRPEKQLLAPGSGQFPVPRPAPRDSLDTPAPSLTSHSGPASGRFPEPEQVHVEEDPTGPIPVPPPDQNPSPDQNRARQFLGIFRRPFAVVAGLLVVAVAGIALTVAVVPRTAFPTAPPSPSSAGRSATPCSTRRPPGSPPPGCGCRTVPGSPRCSCGSTPPASRPAPAARRCRWPSPPDDRHHPGSRRDLDGHVREPSSRGVLPCDDPDARAGRSLLAVGPVGRTAWWSPVTGSPEPAGNAGQDAGHESSATAAASPSASPAQDPSGAEPRHAGSPAKGSRPWPVLTLLGGFALGLPVNALSDAFPGAFLSAVSVVLLLVVSAAYRLRRLDARAPIHTLLPRVTLPLAGLAAVVSLFLDGQPANWAVLMAAALGVTGCLRPGSTDDLFQQLVSVGLIAAGAAILGLGISFLLGSQVLAEVAMVGVGIVVIGLGISGLLDGEVLFGVAVIGGGVAAIGNAIGGLLGSQVLAKFAAPVGFGAAAIGAGISFLLGSQVLAGVAVIGIGVAMLGLGISFLLDSQVLAGVALVDFGVAAIGLGISFLLGGGVLLGVAMIAVGVAAIGTGVELANSGRVVGWFRSLLAAPAGEPVADLEQDHDRRGRAAGPDSVAPPG